MIKKILALLPFFIMGCGVQNVSYQTGTSETQLVLPETNKQIAILNRISPPITQQDVNGYVIPNTPFAINGAISGVQSEIRRRRYFSAYTRQFNMQRANGRFHDSLTAGDLQGLPNNPGLAISLEMWDQQIRDNYTIEIRKERIADRVFKEVDYYVGRRSIDITMGWRLYEVATGRVLDEEVYTDNYFYEGEALSRMAATQLLENNFRREMNNLGAKYGRMYAAKVSPINYYTTRELYISGNTFLEKGIVLVRDDNWDEAEEQWLKGIKREKKRKKLAKLYHNLAVASERKGDSEQAKEYARLAANQHPIGAKTQSIIGY